MSDWFGIQGFTTYSSMDSDDPDVPDFKAFDTGISVNATIASNQALPAHIFAFLVL